MGLHLTSKAHQAASAEGLLPKVRIEPNRLWVLGNGIATAGVLGAILLLPLAYYPYAESVFTTPKAALLQCLAVLSVAGMAIRLLSQRSITVARTPLDLPIAVYLGLVLLAVLRADSLDAALFGPATRSDGLVTLLSAVGLYYVAYHLRADRWLLRRVLICATVAATLVAAEGIAQALGFSLVGLPPNLEDLRAYGTSGHPDFLGGVLTLALPLPVALLATSGRRSRPYWTLALGIVLAGLAVAYVRSAWVGSVAGVAVLFLFGWSSLKQARRWLVVAAGAALLFALLVETGILGISPSRVPLATSQGSQERTLERPTALQRVQNIGDGSGRLLIWEGTLEVIREQPLLGVGYGNFYTAITRHLPLKYSLDHPGTWIDKAHNAYLELAASVGIPGLMAYLWLIGSFALIIVRHLGRRTPSSGRTLLVALLAGWAGYLVHLFFLFDSVETLALSWVLMALGLRDLRPAGPARGLRVSLPSGARVLLALTVVGLSLLAIHGATRPVVAEAYLWGGQQAARQNRSDDAVVAYLKASETNPHSDSLRIEAAMALQTLAQQESQERSSRHFLDGAIRIWNQAIQRDPSLAYLYAMRGKAYSGYPNGEHLADALSDFRQAIVLFPNYYNGYAGVADAARALGLLNEAVAAERKLLELSPDNRQVLGLLAEDYARSARWAEAVAAWERLASLDGDNADLRLHIAEALLAAGQRERGIAELERARALDPGNEQVEKVWQSLQENRRQQ